MNVWVHGPQGIGKTNLAKRIARALGLSQICDEVVADPQSDPSQTRPQPKETLFLSNFVPANFPGLVMSFDEAMVWVQLSERSDKGDLKQAIMGALPASTEAKFVESDFTQSNAQFDAWKATLPATHWSRYDLSACRLGWESGRAPLLATIQHMRFLLELALELLERERDMYQDLVDAELDDLEK